MKEVKSILILLLSIFLFQNIFLFSNEFDKNKFEKFNFKQREFEFEDFKKFEKGTNRLVANFRENFKSEKTDALDIAWEYLEI